MGRGSPFGVGEALRGAEEAGGGQEHELNRTVLDNIARGGFIPMITWEPWVSAFPGHLGETPQGSLSLVASGEFDAYIRAWAREIATALGAGVKRR